MKDLKKQLGKMREVKSQGLISNKLFLKFTQEYEDVNLMCYEANMQEKMVFESAKTKPAIIKAMDHVKDNLWNPFDWMYYWCKGEIYDLKALVASVESRLNLEKLMKKTTGKKLDATEDLGNMQEGKTTMRTVFKNKEDTNSIKV